MSEKATALAQADAIATEVLTPQATEKIDQSVALIRSGRDPHLVLRLLYGMAYMDGMMTMAKVGLAQ